MDSIQYTNSILTIIFGGGVALSIFVVKTLWQVDTRITRIETFINTMFGDADEYRGPKRRHYELPRRAPAE